MLCQTCVHPQKYFLKNQRSYVVLVQLTDAMSFRVHGTVVSDTSVIWLIAQRSGSSPGRRVLHDKQNNSCIGD